MVSVVVGVQVGPRPSAWSGLGFERGQACAICRLCGEAWGLEMTVEQRPGTEGREAREGRAGREGGQRQEQGHN